MKVKNLLKIVLIAIGLLILTQNLCYAETQIESKSGTTAWTDITVSNSFDACQRLNSGYSTLGTDELRAHLSTDADWSAMAIFSASQFGGATSNKPTQTNGNATGIYGLNSIKYYQTTGIYEGTTSTNFASLLKAENSQYVKKYKLNRTDNNNIWFKPISENGTFGMFSSEARYNTNTGGPASIKQGLFGVRMLDPFYRRTAWYGWTTN